MNNKISWQQFKVLFFVRSFLALFSIITGMASAAEAATIDIKDTNYEIPSGAYFVSPDGKDTNSGKAPDSPWPVAKAIASAPDQSTVVFRGGTYRNIGEISIRKQLTLQAYPHEKAWIKGSITVTDWVADGNIWRKDGWSYSFPSNFSSIFIDPEYPLAGYRDMVYINGVSLKQVASKAGVVSGTFYVDSANDRLYVGSNPVDKTVEATARKEAFAMWKASSDPSGTVVRGLGFAHYADRALSIGAPSVKLENNTFAWNGREGATFWGQSSGVSGVSADAIVLGNTFSYNALKGLGGGRTHRLLLEENTFSYNNVERFATDWDAAGAKFTEADGMILRNNLVEHNFSTGLWVDISSTNTTIVNNVSRYNQEMGIFFEISHKAIIAANVVYKNALAGIFVSNASSARIYNNTLADNGTNLRIKDTTRDNTNSQEIAAGITWISRDNVAKNNILSSKAGNTPFDATNCGTGDQSSDMISATDYNAYYRQSSSQIKNVVKWSTSAKCSIPYTSIAAFKAATSFEKNALAIDNTTTNPFFVDETNGKYNLKPNSPAIGRGLLLPADIAKAIGLPAGVPVDLGAIQSK